MLNTGAQITIVDSALASDLELRPESSIGIISAANYASADLVTVGSMDMGQYRIERLRAATQNLHQIRTVNPKVQGILGEDFLARFDLVINNAHKYVCLDQTGRMRQAILGQRVSFLMNRIMEANPRFTQPVLISVHLPEDSKQGTILRLDSGSTSPVLFSSRGQILPWLQRTHASRGSVSGTEKVVPFAALPSQTVRVTDHLERQLAFVTPISNGTPYAKVGEDGLLPTTLFKEILISFPGRFVVFDPRDGCLAAESN